MTTKNNLETQLESLQKQLLEERAKTEQVKAVLGQLRWRISEVLDLDPTTRNQLVQEVDAVFRRALAE